MDHRDGDKRVTTREIRPQGPRDGHPQGSEADTGAQGDPAPTVGWEFHGVPQAGCPRGLSPCGQRCMGCSVGVSRLLLGLPVSQSPVLEGLPLHPTLMITASASLLPGSPFPPRQDPGSLQPLPPSSFSSFSCPFQRLHEAHLLSVFSLPFGDVSIWGFPSTSEQNSPCWNFPCPPPPGAPHSQLPPGNQEIVP